MPGLYRLLRINGCSPRNAGSVRGELLFSSRRRPGRGGEVPCRPAAAVVSTERGRGSMPPRCCRCADGKGGMVPCCPGCSRGLASRMRLAGQNDCRRRDCLQRRTSVRNELLGNALLPDEASGTLRSPPGRFPASS